MPIMHILKSYLQKSMQLSKLKKSSEKMHAMHASKLNLRRCMHHLKIISSMEFFMSVQNICMIKI